MRSARGRGPQAPGEPERESVMEDEDGHCMLLVDQLLIKDLTVGRC